MGLAGLGDLVLTCTGDASRNRRVGLALARGQPLPEILAELGHVAEGVPASRAVRDAGAAHGVEMPICEAVDRVLHESMPVREARARAAAARAARRVPLTLSTTRMPLQCESSSFVCAAGMALDLAR